ncbi:phage holin [Sporosarcina sp. G11-34]|uniref:phage holin n=1 Tax=Sporosarcina sp. G11-34 TaxID=2849605 RepID=UPI0022A96259|nr:phage holin [Sporosarcina sp. G11-34]MCZ2260613.1 phage holin [Sporosarcina sp. G11-34]
MTNRQTQNAPIDRWMIARAVVLFIALFNQMLVMSGLSSLPFDDGAIESAVTITLTVSAALWAWWKDNDVTYKARRRNKFNKDKGLK